MNLQKTKAFTLVELIVVITILAILGTIAFISMQGYSKSSRDSVRTSDMSKIKSSLELFNIGAGKYPSTTGGVTVTYTGETVWTQGLFGDTTFTNVDRLDKIPKDPLTDKEYTYSVLNTGQEYEIAGLMEGDDFAFNPLLLNPLFAAGEKIARAKITGNYNGKIAKIKKGTDTVILAVPTIISGSGVLLDDIIKNKTFVYTGYSNLPFSYNGTAYNSLGESPSLNLVDENNYVVFTGDVSTLKGENPDARILMLENLKTAYSGSSIEDSAISELLSITDFSSTNPLVVSLAGTVVNNTLGGSIETVKIDNVIETISYPIPTTGLIVEHLFEDNSDLGNDTVGSYNGTNYGATQTLGINDSNAILLNGSSNYIDLGNIDFIEGTSSGTTSIWFNVTNPGSSNIIYSNGWGSVADNSFSTIVTTGLGAYASWGSTNADWAVINGGSVSNNEWYHLSQVFNGDETLTYLNGALINTSVLGGPLNILSSNFRLGLASSGQYYFDGRLDNFRVYDKPLTQSEISNLYYEGLTNEQILAKTSNNKLSCKNILDTWSTALDGTYTIDPDGSGGNPAFDVYCDMNSDGGGWTLVGKRTNTSTNVQYGICNTDVLGSVQYVNDNNNHGCLSLSNRESLGATELLSHYNDGASLVKVKIDRNGYNIDTSIMNACENTDMSKLYRAKIIEPVNITTTWAAQVTGADCTSIWGVGYKPILRFEPPVSITWDVYDYDTRNNQYGHPDETGVQIQTPSPVFMFIR